MNLGRCYCKT